MKEFKRKLNAKRPLTDKGPIGKFLNMSFSRDRQEKTISLSQKSKILKLKETNELTDEDKARINIPSKIPAYTNIKLSQDMCPKTPSEISYMKNKPYKSLLGQVLFICITSRPDIATAVSICGKYASNPGKQHWLALLKIVSYLLYTKDLVLTLGGSSGGVTLSAYSDADWGGDIDDRRSRTGYVILLNNSPIIWSSKLQTSTSLSSTEAEYVALSLTSRDVLWCRKLLKELGHAQQEATSIFEDNDSCIKIAQSKKQLPGIKHIDVAHHFIRDQVHNSEVTLKRKRTAEMTADILTKNLPAPTFLRHRKQLKLNSYHAGEVL